MGWDILYDAPWDDNTTPTGYHLAYNSALNRGMVRQPYTNLPVSKHVEKQIQGGLHTLARCTTGI